MAKTPTSPGEAAALFSIAERRIPSGLQVLCIRPDAEPGLAEALSRRSVAQGLLLDDSPEHAVAAKALLADPPRARIDTVCADLFATRSYEGRVPADVIVLGSRLTAGDEVSLQALVEALPRLCSRDALIVWPQAHLDSERRTLVRRMLDRAGFESEPPRPDAGWHHARHVGVPVRLEGVRL